MTAPHAPSRPLIACHDGAALLKVLRHADGTAIQKIHPPRRGDGGTARVTGRRSGNTKEVDPPAQENRRESDVRGGYFYYSAFPPPLPPLLKLHSEPRSWVANVNGGDVSWLTEKRNTEGGLHRHQAAVNCTIFITTTYHFTPGIFGSSLALFFRAKKKCTVSEKPCSQTQLVT